MRVVLMLMIAGGPVTGCSPVEIAVPLAGVDGWVQVLSDNEVGGVPLLAMNW